jgi:hypothetical protein
VTTSTATLEWSSLAGAVSYNVTLLDSFGNAVAAGSGLNTTSWTTPSLTGVVSSGEQFFWYVQANINYNGTTVAGPPSGRSKFTLGQYVEPTILSPLSGTTVTTAFPTLKWSTVPGYSSGYSLSLFDVTADTSLIYAHQSFFTALALGFPLVNGHTYEWSVSTFDDSSNPTTADFTVSLASGGTESLAAPTLIGPTGLISTYSPTFTWNPVQGATGYVFFYTYDGGQNAVQLPENLTGTSTTVDLTVGSLVPILDGLVFEWWVMAYDAAGNGSPPSTPMDFSPSVVQSGQPAAPTDLSPSGTVTSATPTFSWSAIPGYTGYYTFTVADETTGLTPLDVGTDKTSVSIIALYAIEHAQSGSPLSNGHQYRWYVNAQGSYPTVPSGLVASQTFTLSVPGDEVPAPTSPAAGTIVNTMTPQFQWSAVTGAVGYLIFIADAAAFQTEDLFFFDSVSVTTNSYTPSNLLLDGHTYHWQVCALFNNGGTSVIGPTSDPEQFTVSVPGTATLDAHDDSGTLTTTTPMLQWSTVSGASGYDLSLEDATSNTQVFDALPLATTSYAITTPLNNGDSYQWYVTAFDNYGDIGVPPAALTFTVSVTTATLPTATLTGPIGITKGASPVFQWTKVPNAVGYALYVKDTTTGNIVYSGLAVNGLSYQPSSPLPGNDTFDWYVRAIYSDGTLGPAPAGADFGVTTAADLAGPPTPSLPVGTTDASPTFRWSAVTGATGYELQVLDTTGGSISYPLTPTPVNGTSYTPASPLTPGRTYEWEVAAYDSAGHETTWSNPLSFRVNPIPTSPSGTTSAAEPMFLWSLAAGATSYQIEVMEITAGANSIVIGPTSIVGTSYTPGSPLSVGHTYQWQVLATDSSGASSPWSSPLTFHILPSTPSPIFPIGTTILTMPQLQWVPVSGAVSYQVQVTDTTDGASTVIVAPSAVGQPPFTLATQLTPGHSYQWQVAASDATGFTSPWSSPTSFFIILPPPPYVSNIAHVTVSKGKVSAVTIAFDEALQATSADSTSFYQMVPITIKRKRTVYGKPLRFTVSYDGNLDVTIRLRKPVIGKLQLTVYPGILATNSARSLGIFSSRVSPTMPFAVRTLGFQVGERATYGLPMWPTASARFRVPKRTR